MKKFLSMLLIVLTFTWVHVTHGNINGEIPIEYVSQVIADLQKLFHSRCVYILQASEEENFAQKRNLLLQRLLAGLDVQTSVLQLETCNSITQCRCNRPLYIIFYSNNEVLQQISSRTSSTNARWLFFLPHPNSLEDTFRQVNIPLNCEFLVIQQEDEMIQITEVYRVNVTFPLEVNRVGNWSRVEGLQWSNSPLYKRRNNLRGLVFKATMSIAEPATTVTSLGNKHYSVEGFIGKLWSALAVRLNFSTQFLEPLVHWGTEVNGKWNGMIGVITRNEADVAVAAFSMSPFRIPVLDFLTPVIVGKAMLYIRKPEKFWPNWTSFFSPLKFKLWISIAGAVLFLSVGLSVTSVLGNRYENGGAHCYTLYDSVLCVFGSFCSQGQDSTPKSWPCRVVYLTSYLVGVVLLASYSAALISFLAVKRTLLPFQTLQELVQDGTYKLYLSSGDQLTYFRNSPTDFARTVYTKMIAPIESSLPTPLEGLQTLCSNPKFVYLTSTYVVEYAEGRRRIGCRIISLPQSAEADTLCLIVKKGSPYKDILNYYIQKMKYNGELNRIRELYWYRDLHDPEEQIFEVDMKTVSPIFIILMSGVLVATMFLIYERGRNLLLYNLKMFACRMLKTKKYF